MRRRGRGFTLVEVLVALAMVSIAILAALRAMSSLAHTNAELRLRFLALMAAENRIAVVRASKVFPPLGERSLPCPQAEARLICEERVQSTPNTVFRRIEVKVRAPDSSFVLAKLTTVLPEGL